LINDKDIKALFPVLKEVTYLNTASIGLIPKTSLEKAYEWLSQREYGNKHWLDWYDEFTEAKELFAKLINAKRTEIAGISNTSEGLNLVANSIKWRPDDVIVLNDLEFPTNVFIWQVIAKKYGLKLKIVQNKNGRVPLEEYENLMDRKVKVVAVSWVQFSNGYVHDLKELAEIVHAHDAYLVVDGIQGVGSLSLDVSKAKPDFLTCGGQKWLMGFPGTGFLYVRSEVLDDLNISFAGWLGDKQPFRFDYREFEPAEGAVRFELGTPNFIGFSAIKESLKLILDIGINTIEKHNLELASYLVEQLGTDYIDSPLSNGKPLSPILKLKVKNPDKVYKELISRKIWVSLRKGGIRVSTHIYNRKNHIDLLISTIRKLDK